MKWNIVTEPNTAMIAIIADVLMFDQSSKLPSLRACIAWTRWNGEPIATNAMKRKMQATDGSESKPNRITNRNRLAFSGTVHPIRQKG